MADIKAKRISDLSPKTDITPDAKLPIIDKTAGGSYDNFNMPVAILTTLAKGNTGPEGPEGPQGVQGPQGLKGDKGDKGDTGLTGATGATGPQGVQGLKGDKGDKGDTGDVGPQGPIGLQGVQGPKGDQGDVGPQGPKGDQGVKGDTGAGVNIIGTLNDPSELPASGNTGDAYIISGDLYVWTGTSWENVGSIEGPMGPQGPEGPQGPQGAKGDQGIQGAEGPQGLQGIQGIPGAKGDKGDTGAAGPGVAIGGTTGQILGKKSGTNYDTEWIDKPTSGVWGQITGTLSNQTDLNSALAGKANSSHTHSTTNLTATGGTATSFLRKDNTWATPTNTTYSEITSAEITAGTASTARAITGRMAQGIVNKAQTGVVKSTTTNTLTTGTVAPASPSTGDVWVDTNPSMLKLADTAVGIGKIPEQGALDVEGDIYSSGVKVSTQTPLHTCILRTSSLQNIASGGTAPLAFSETDLFDPYNWHNPSSQNTRINVSVTGLYRLLGSVQWVDRVGSYRIVGFRINGTNMLLTTRSAPDSDGRSANSVIDYTLLNAGDYVELTVNHGTGSSIGIPIASVEVSLVA